MTDCQKRGHIHLTTTCNDCHHVINHAEFKDPNEWISVKDRMPKIDEFPRNQVLTWDGQDIVGHIPSFYNDGSSSFFTCGGPPVTHWMPPPEPPE